MIIVTVKSNTGDDISVPFAGDHVDITQAKRLAYEVAYGSPTHPEERATDETIDEYTTITRAYQIPPQGETK